MKEEKIISRLKAEFVTKNSVQECIDFLENRKETSLFLLANLSNCSVEKNEHTNHYLLRFNSQDQGDFSFNKAAYMLIQTHNKDK
ncbi:MAG: hypothetical protein OXN83_02315 [Oligoflexia bacterium]|nr:hypothetical protein [Oligoflexia bacterium]